MLMTRPSLYSDEVLAVSQNVLMITKVKPYKKTLTTQQSDFRFIRNWILRNSIKILLPLEWTPHKLGLAR